jgi:hypothetical protein
MLSLKSRRVGANNGGPDDAGTDQVARNPRSNRCALRAPKCQPRKTPIGGRVDREATNVTNVAVRIAIDFGTQQDSTGLNCCPTAPLGALRRTSVIAMACSFAKSTWPGRMPDTVRNVEADGSSPFTSTREAWRVVRLVASLPAGRQRSGVSTRDRSRCRGPCRVPSIFPLENPVRLHLLSTPEPGTSAPRIGRRRAGTHPGRDGASDPTSR